MLCSNRFYLYKHRWFLIMNKWLNSKMFLKSCWNKSKRRKMKNISKSFFFRWHSQKFFSVSIIYQHQNVWRLTWRNFDFSVNSKKKNESVRKFLFFSTKDFNTFFSFRKKRVWSLRFFIMVVDFFKRKFRVQSMDRRTPIVK